ncbi:MAG: exodeoxyribonuclease V subunit alpha [Hahellaceae bacterium]|nr:exodeoxyribonuclease V subunit alpha [Hahellaceae bacterium]
MNSVLKGAQPYRDFRHATSVIAGLQAIDFYLANDLCQALATAIDADATPTEMALLWHSVAMLSQCLRDGHSCADLRALASSLWGQARQEDSTAPGFRFPAMAPWCAALSVFKLSPAHEQPLVLDGERLYLRRYWQFETEVALALSQRQRRVGQVALERRNALLQRLFPELTQANVAPDWQRQAVDNALTRDFSVITGGPGTGKTTTVTKLLYALGDLHRHDPDKSLSTPWCIRMAAPTGKAAQRLVESIRNSKQALSAQGFDAEILALIPEQAATVHRLLGVIPESLQFRHHETNPLHVDVLLVDEVSMVDLPLMARLLRALPPKARLILLGDADQLPSVAAGSLLAELARPRQGHDPAYLSRLVHSYRFSDEGAIGQLAKAVIQGRANAAWKIASQPADLFGQVTLADCRTRFDDWIGQIALEHYRPVIEASDIQTAFHALSRFRLLCSHRAGTHGVEAINFRIEQHMVAQGIIHPVGPHYAGRPVMVTENHYPLGLYNGDIGLLWYHQQRLMAAFPGNEGDHENGIRWLHLAQLPRIETVYAMTIHKTQGSEYENIALVLPDEDSPLLSRELLYTGITRAKKHATLWANEGVFKKCVERQVKRYSGLSERLTGSE